MSKQIFQKFDVEFRKKVIVPTPEGDDEAVNLGQLNDKDSIKDSNETTGVGNIKFWTGTQEEYDLITTPNSDTIYYIKEA